MNGVLIQGDVTKRPGGVLDGWCVLLRAQNRRARVTVLVNGEPLIDCVAAKLRPDVLEMGLGDGHCGFSVQLPVPVSEHGTSTFVAVRESESGSVFGQLRLDPEPRASSGPLLHAELILSRAWRTYSDVHEQTIASTEASSWFRAFGMLADYLAPHGAAPRRPGPSRCVTESADDLAVFLLARPSGVPSEPLRSLVPALRALRAQAFVVGGPTASTASAVSYNVERLNVPPHRTSLQVALSAARACRAARAAIIDPVAGASSAALLALAYHVEQKPGLFLNCRSLGASTPASPVVLPAELGVLLCAKPSDLRDLGCVGDLASADIGHPARLLAQRARLLGLPVWAVRNAVRLAADTNAPRPSIPAAHHDRT